MASRFDGAIPDPRPRKSRRMSLLGLLILLIAGVIGVIAGVNALSDASQSDYVQAHGVRRPAVIQSVNNVSHQSQRQTGSGSNARTQYFTTYTAEVLVQLAEPVDGRTQTTVHVPHAVNDNPGTALTVLVSPKDPGYAELPGTPSAPNTVSQYIIGFSAALILIAAYAGLRVSRARRRAASTPSQRW